eukprot:126986-Chlamydomonas_euryale.AAC.15
MAERALDKQALRDISKTLQSKKPQQVGCMTQSCARHVRGWLMLCNAFQCATSSRGGPGEGVEVIASRKASVTLSSYTTSSSSASASEPDFLSLLWPMEPLHTPPRARAWARIPHCASSPFPAQQPLQPREALLAAAACPAAYQGPASA